MAIICRTSYIYVQGVMTSQERRVVKTHVDADEMMI
jgi:hypothetical protein